MRRNSLLNFRRLICHYIWALPTSDWRATSSSSPSRWWCRGRQIPFVRSSDRDKATLDVIGMVLDSDHHPLNRIRDTVKLAVNTSAEVQKKNVQYDTGMSLLSGKYHLKLVVRENQTGRMGSFETDIDVPDLKAQPLKMSSVVLASQTQAAKKRYKSEPADSGRSRDHSEHHACLLGHPAFASLLRGLRSGTAGGHRCCKRRAPQEAWYPTLDQRSLLPG